MSDDLKGKIEVVVNQAASDAEKSIASYAELAKEAGGQLSGEASADTGAWLKLTARTYAQAAGDVARVWTTGYDVLQVLAEHEDPPGGGGGSDE